MTDDEATTVLSGHGTVSPSEPEEYHRKVDWYGDLRALPISTKEIVPLRGSNPRGPFSALNTGKEAIMCLVNARAEKIDVERIASDTGKGLTEIEVLCLARRGQGKYREDLLNLWDRKCAVTACDLSLFCGHPIRCRGAFAQTHSD